MRQGLHVVGNLARLLTYFLKTAPNLRMIVLHLFEFYRNHCKSLIDVVMKLSPDAGAFLLLCFDQAAAHRAQQLLRASRFGHDSR